MMAGPRSRQTRRQSPARRPRRRTLSEALVSVWRQALVQGQSEVILGRRRYAVSSTRRKQLRSVSFPFGRRRFFGIEQNPATASRWAAMARAGKPVMQFSHKGQYVANVNGGKIFRYPAWRSHKLPE
jgi:hypothetical protein